MCLPKLTFKTRGVKILCCTQLYLKGNAIISQEEAKIYHNILIEKKYYHWNPTDLTKDQKKGGKFGIR